MNPTRWHQVEQIYNSHDNRLKRDIAIRHRHSISRLARPSVEIRQGRETLMTQVHAQAAGNPKHSYYLTGNGALMMLAGLLCGLTISAAPYPRLMLTAHIQFLVNGMMSVFAGLMLKTSLSIVGRRSGVLIVWGHVSAWAVCFSEVAGAVWGANKALPIAAAQAGASGAAPWQESLVVACHVVPALFLIAAWILLVWGVYRGGGERYDAPPE